MSAGETARKNYESARNELVQRIQLREQILLFFVGGVATIYSVALGAENKLEILLAIPYLSFGTAVIRICDKISCSIIFTQAWFL